MYSILDTRTGVAISTDLLSAIERIEDRLKCWYEVLHKCEPEGAQVLLNGMRTDMGLLLDQIPERLMTISTGVTRLDELKSELELMCGRKSVLEVIHSLSAFTIYSDPQELRSHKYFGDFNAIIKRGEVVAQVLRSEGSNTAWSDSPEYAVRGSIRFIDFKEVNAAKVVVPDGECIGVSIIKGTRMMVIRCVDGMTRYVTVPDAKPHIVHTQPQRREWGTFIEKWLCRLKTTDDELF
jgi:hypothetical protein